MINNPNVIVWLAGAVKLCVTGAAAAYVALPAWLATMEQVPPPTTVTVVPATVHTVGVVEAKLTVRPELEVALLLAEGKSLQHGGVESVKRKDNAPTGSG